MQLGKAFDEKMEEWRWNSKPAILYHTYKSSTNIDRHNTNKAHTQSHVTETVPHPSVRQDIVNHKTKYHSRNFIIIIIIRYIYYYYFFGYAHISMVLICSEHEPQTFEAYS